MQEQAGYTQVDKTWGDGIDLVKIRRIQIFRHSLSDLNGRPTVGLGSGQSAVTLVFAQIRPVGHGNPAIGPVKTGFFKGIFHFMGNEIENFFHGSSPHIKFILLSIPDFYGKV